MNTLCEFSKEHPGLIFINMCFMAMIPLNEVLLPHLYGKLIDAIQHKKDFLKYFISLIVVLGIVQVGYSLGDWHDTYINPSFQSFTRQKMLNSIIDKYENSFQDISSGDVITKFVKAPWILMTWFKNVKDYLLPYSLVFICAAVYFLYYDLILGVTLIVTMVLIMILLITSPFKCKRQTLDQSKVYHELHEEIDDILINIISVYGSGQKDSELKRIYGMDQQYRNAFFNTMKCILKFKVISIPIIIGFFSIFIFRCNALISSNKMKISNFVSLFMIITYMMGTLIWLVDIIRDIIFDWGMIKETEDLLEVNIKVPTPSSLVSYNDIPYEGIGLKNVSFTYDGTVEPTLINLTMHIARGEKIVLLGDIGSGKSTILKLMMRFYMPSEGDLYIDGQPYSSMTTYQIRRKIAYVPQNPILFNRTIYENIKYGNPDLTNMDIDQIMSDFNIHDEFSNLDNGLDSKIGKNGSKLSGGQRQLVWCLRVLLLNPDYILMDEFTSAMDKKTKDLIIRILQVFMVDKTIIMITHDPYLLKFATRKIYVEARTHHHHNS